VFEHSKNRIFCSEKLPPSDATNRNIIDARAALAAYYINYSHMAKANEVVVPIADLALEMNYQERLGMIYSAMGVFCLWFPEDYEKAYRYLNEALRISETTKDKISSFLTCWNLGWHYSWDCQFEKGEEYFKKCLAMSEAVNNLLGISSVKSTVSAMNFLFQGKIDLATQTIKDSLVVAEKSGDNFAKGLAYSSNGLLGYIKGVIHNTEDSLLKGLAFCEKTNQTTFIVCTSGWLGLQYIELEKYGMAQTYFNKARSIAVEYSGLTPSLINMWVVCIARARVLNQDRDIDLTYLFKCYQDNKLRICEGWMARDIGEILMNLEDQHIPEAQDWISKAVEADKRNGMMWHLGKDYALYAELFKRKGDQPRARENLGKAIEILRECGADGWVEKYEKKLATLS
jgi:tetratricopeptide (TPR) repeat protein